MQNQFSFDVIWTVAHEQTYKTCINWITAMMVLYYAMIIHIWALTIKCMRLAGLALLLSVGAITASNADITQFEISGDLNNFRFNAIKSIPNGPHPDVSKVPCAWFSVPTDDQKFSISRSIQNKGWGILSEVRLAKYHLIAFAGSFSAGTSNTCSISQGNIAIFEQNNLLGIIHLDAPEATLIGSLELMDAGFIRVFSGDTIQMPVADIHLSLNAFELKTISDLTAHCNGTSIVPSVFGKDIIEARNVLINHGFEPIEAIEPSLPVWRMHLINDGIREVDACSGIGYSFCKFRYKNENSSVNLITAGDDAFPSVVRIGVNCME